MKILSFALFVVKNKLLQVQLRLDHLGTPFNHFLLSPFYFRIFIVFEENAFVTKSRANAFTHSLKKRMAAAASVAKAGSGATVRLKPRREYFYFLSHYIIFCYCLD